MGASTSYPSVCLYCIPDHECPASIDPHKRRECPTCVEYFNKYTVVVNVPIKKYDEAREYHKNNYCKLGLRGGTVMSDGGEGWNFYDKFCDKCYREQRRPVKVEYFSEGVPSFSK